MTVITGILVARLPDGCLEIISSVLDRLAQLEEQLARQLEPVSQPANKLIEASAEAVN